MGNTAKLSMFGRDGAHLRIVRQRGGGVGHEHGRALAGHGGQRVVRVEVDVPQRLGERLGQGDVDRFEAVGPTQPDPAPEQPPPFGGAADRLGQSGRDVLLARRSQQGRGDLLEAVEPVGVPLGLLAGRPLRDSKDRTPSNRPGESAGHHL